jgi:hypothetical protein
MKKLTFKLVLMILILYFQSTAWSQEYTFKRSTVMLPNGVTLDSLRGELSVRGTMTVDGTALKQSIENCINTTTPPTCSSVEVASQILSVDVNNSAVSLTQPDGSVSEVILLSLNPIITMLNGGSFVEVDQWELADPLSSTSNQVMESTENQGMVNSVENGKFGSTTFDALQSLGLVQSP